MTTISTSAPGAHLPPMTTDRRAFLAAAPAVAVLTAKPALASIAPAAANPSRAAWDAALRRYTQVLTASAYFEAVEFNPAWDRERAFLAEHGVKDRWPDGRAHVARLREQHPDQFVPDELDNRLEKFGTEISDAEWELMSMPAPDEQALAWKFDHILGVGSKQDSTPSWSREYVAQTIADYRRLLGEA